MMGIIQVIPAWTLYTSNFAPQCLGKERTWPDKRSNAFAPTICESCLATARRGEESCG
jgi:hypothetical protein